MTEEELDEVTWVYGPGTVGRPFCNPSPDVTVAAMTGSGGVRPRPGELSRANRGVLFLNEVQNYETRVLECLRQPLFEGQITLVRAHARTSFPATVQVVATMPSCPGQRFSVPLFEPQVPLITIELSQNWRGVANAVAPTRARIVEARKVQPAILDADSEELLESIHTTARTAVVHVASSIAAVDRSTIVQATHLTEALQYRLELSSRREARHGSH